MISCTSRRSPRSGYLFTDDVVLAAEQAHLQQLGDFDHAGADAVVDVVVVVGDLVGEVGDLGFEAGLAGVG